MKTVNIKIPREEFNKMNELLKKGCDISSLNLEPNETIFSYRGHYSNGYEAIVEVFTGNESVMGSVYIYDNNFDEVCSIESDSELNTFYEYKTDNDEYKITIELID